MEGSQAFLSADHHLGVWDADGVPLFGIVFVHAYGA